MREKIANFFPTPEIVTNTTIDIRSTVHERAHFRKSFAKNHLISLTTLVYNDKKYYNCIQFNKTLFRYKLQKREINKTDMKMLCPSLLILVFHLLKRLLKIPSPKRTKNRMDRAAATIKNRGTAYIRFCK